MLNEGRGVVSFNAFPDHERSSGAVGRNDTPARIAWHASATGHPSGGEQPRRQHARGIDSNTGCRNVVRPTEQNPAKAVGGTEHGVAVVGSAANPQTLCRPAWCRVARCYEALRPVGVVGGSYRVLLDGA